MPRRQTAPLEVEPGGSSSDVGGDMPGLLPGETSESETDQEEKQQVRTPKGVRKQQVLTPKGVRRRPEEVPTIERPVQARARQEQGAAREAKNAEEFRRIRPRSYRGVLSRDAVTLQQMREAHEGDWATNGNKSHPFGRDTAEMEAQVRIRLERDFERCARTAVWAYLPHAGARNFNIRRLGLWARRRVARAWCIQQARAG